MLTRPAVVLALSLLTAAGVAYAQPTAATPPHASAAARAAASRNPQAPPASLVAPVPNDKEVAATQRQLIELLRISPTLTTVVARDPSLLSDQDYVSRNNPQLAAFLVAHPEVARNPDFYLFTHLHIDGAPDEAIEHAVWPESFRRDPPRTGFDELLSNLVPLLAFACALAVLLWIIRVFVENRRWTRTFKLQSEVHSKLIEKFSSSQELAAYMETEAGRRFLEAAPIPLHDDSSRRMPNAVSRVLTPVQVGTVMILLGVGFLALRHVGIGYEVPMRVLGVLILMPGIGFILSAGFTWLLATRLGLMPTGNPPAGSEPSAWDPNSLTRR